MQPPLGVSVMLATHLACIRKYPKPSQPEALPLVLCVSGTAFPDFRRVSCPQGARHLPARGGRIADCCPWALKCEALPGSGFVYTVAVSVPSTEDRWDIGRVGGGYCWWWSLLEGGTLTFLPAYQVCELI